MTETNSQDPGPSTEDAQSPSTEVAPPPEDRPQMTTQAERFTFLRELQLRRRHIDSGKDK